MSSRGDDRLGSAFHFGTRDSSKLLIINVLMSLLLVESTKYSGITLQVMF